MASSQSFSMIHRRMLLSPCPASPVNNELPLWTSAILLPSGVSFHLAQHVCQEEQLSVAAPGDQGVFGVAGMLDDEPGVGYATLAAHLVLVGLPALPIGRVADHKVERLALEGIVGQGGVFRSTDDVGVGVFLSLQEQVGLADGVGLRVNLLPVQMRGDFLPLFLCYLLEGLLGDGEHPAGPQGAVVEQVGVGLDLVLDRQEYQFGHEFHGVPGGPVFAGFLVVLFVEPPEQVLEDGPHGVVVQPGQSDLSLVVQDRGGAEVHCLGQEPFNQGVESAAGREPGYLVSELKLLQDVLDVGREPVQVGVEVISELLLGGGVPEVPQGKRRGVEELLPGRLLEGTCLVRDVLFVHPLFFCKDLLLGGFEHGVEPADDGHGKYHVAVLSPDKEVPEYAVGDVPDEVGDGGELAVLQG